MNKDAIRADIISGYMKEVNVLFEKRGLPHPINLIDRKDPVSILIANLRAQEDIASQRNPFAPQMVAEFIRRGKTSAFESLEALVMNVTVVGRQKGY